jgi:hypothetical protein
MKRAMCSSMRKTFKEDIIILWHESASGAAVRKAIRLPLQGQRALKPVEG